jgi:predicted porin
MQKKIIALAVAGLVSGVALAQSNVTVYGIADADYTWSKSHNGLTGANAGDYKFSGIRDGVDNGLNGSRVGFKGEEGLGNGLKAVFQIEFRVNTPTGDQTQATRQSFLGLDSAAAGRFLIGRQYNASSDIYGNFSSNAVTTVMPVNSFQGVGGSTMVSQGGNSRESNVLKWISPNWSGFTGRLSYAFSNNANTTSASYDTNASESDNGRWSTSLDYANGPLELGAAYNRTSSAYLTNAVPGNVNNYYGANGAFTTPFANHDPLQGKAINEWFLGGVYDFKVVKVIATYQQMKNNNDDLVAITNSKMWSLGASVPVGNGKINLEYAKITFKQDNNPLAIVEDGGNKGFGIGYEYYFSKRTTGYAYYSNLKYDSNTATTTGVVGGIPSVGGGAAVGTAAAGETQNNVSIGLRHVF